ncbi:hypothetical protein [Actinomadura sp. DC4]|uniref:hypothetical protein n=1 Tax=Actinomadura sp. DC4 TaxID=3055069 RepID=UPI0025B188A9|nr:hypothetical protein [Actinomadura sp. DC4]MDN3354788.1 hypothetical protein [Actinomadura sp. DC4]
MKIPRRVNAALDWAAGNARLILIVLPLAVAAVAVLFVPALAAFAVGVVVGGVVVHIQMRARVARLRAEADELLRENGALRHQKTVIAKEVAKETAATESVLTQKLPSIPEEYGE